MAIACGVQSPTPGGGTGATRAGYRNELLSFTVSDQVVAALRPREDVRRARVGEGVVVPVRPDDDDSVADGDGVAGQVARRGVARDELGDL